MGKACGLTPTFRIPSARRRPPQKPDGPQSSGRCAAPWRPFARPHQGAAIDAAAPATEDIQENKFVRIHDLRSVKGCHSATRQRVAGSKRDLGGTFILSVRLNSGSCVPKAALLRNRANWGYG